MKRRIRVFVVEDEAILLRNMEKKIREVSEDFEIAGEAFDGQEALEKIRADCPDIVFTDIRMPVMDGLELVRILREEYPGLTIIIVSGYDEFEYARTALQYQVRNYLLKPLQREALKEVLFSLREDIENKRRLEAEEILKSCLEGTTQQGEGSFLLFLVCMGNLRLQAKWESPSAEPAAGELVRDLLDKTPSLFGSEHWVFPGKQENLCLVLAEEAPGLPPPIRMAELLLEELLHRSSSETCNVAYSEGCVPCACLRREQETLYRVLEESLVIGRSDLFLGSEQRPELPSAAMPVSVIQYLQTLIHIGNAAGFERQLLQMFEEWQEQNRPQQWISRQLIQILNVIQRALGLAESVYTRISDRIFSILESSVSISEAGEEIVEELMGQVFPDLSGEITKIVEEMEAFIRSHYTENINLADLAEKYHFNQSYLTRMFKKETGVLPLKLINTLRIRDAKEMLAQGRLSVREISEMLGFSNQHYFSRIFKDFTGMTPREYRGLSQDM